MVVGKKGDLPCLRLLLPASEWDLRRVDGARVEVMRKEAIAFNLQFKEDGYEDQGRSSERI